MKNIYYIEILTDHMRGQRKCEAMNNLANNFQDTFFFVLNRFRSFCEHCVPWCYSDQVQTSSTPFSTPFYFSYDCSNNVFVVKTKFLQHHQVLMNRVRCEKLTGIILDFWRNRTSEKRGRPSTRTQSSFERLKNTKVKQFSTHISKIWILLRYRLLWAFLMFLLQKSGRSN
jgi:hypothetical protein